MIIQGGVLSLGASSASPKRKISAVSYVMLCYGYCRLG